MSKRKPFDPAKAERDRQEKAEAAWIAGAIRETAELEAARGGEVIQLEAKRGETTKPYRRKAGLDWLLSKNRLLPCQLAAGLKYGDDYRAANDVRVKSILADSFGGDGLVQMEAREEARGRLKKARERGLSNHPELIALCDRVAGEGERLTELSSDHTDSQRNEARLLVALDLLAKHYGMVL